MCGIVGGYTPSVEKALPLLRHRGPDAENLVSVGDLWLGHTRLAILDLDARSDQPFRHSRVTLTYNGELWNYRALRTELEHEGLTFQTEGDTEVVAAALDRWGTEALPRFNGMFALTWTTDGERVFLARDRFGEVPLHLAHQQPFRFASEKKALLAAGAHPQAIQDMPPGTMAEATRSGLRFCPYYDAPTAPVEIDREEARERLFALLQVAVTERAIADAPACTLLSGGIDSSLVAALLKPVVPGLVAYTAVYDPRSADLRNARRVAEHLGIELREVPIPMPTPDDLARVVRTIEMPHKAQVEIGWPCLFLAARMREEGFKVTFSGEGSDELWASYGFAYHALKTQNWHAYRKRLFLSQSSKNFARCNKAFLAHSIECRLPFLHPALVEFALSLPQNIVQDGRTRPKALLQDAFRDLLPACVTRRAKVAFQDGLGLKAAIARLLPHPERYYHAEYNRTFA